MIDTTRQRPGTQRQPPPSFRARIGQWTSERWALVALIGLLVAALPILLFWLGADRWFFRDEWNFITDRQVSSLNDLFRDHNTHWSTLPVIAFRAMWAMFGLRTYVPYEAATILVHLTTVALLWAVMRRCDVNAWLATFVAATFVFFGPGQENIVWGFQIGYVGAFAFGLVFLLLVERPGPLSRRDALGVGAGLVALLCSGVALTMIGVVGLVLLLKRGWRVALVDIAPLALVYLMWLAIVHPELSEYGSAPVGALREFVQNGIVGTFVAIGHYPVVASLIAVVLVVGLGVAWLDGARADRLAVPVALIVGGVFFFTTTGEGRWVLGAAGARSDRYLYMGTAFMLPALAVAIDALRRRWAPAAVLGVCLLLVAVPANVSAFGSGIFGPNYFHDEKSIITEVVRMPFAKDVPRDVKPYTSDATPPGLDIGFLLDAVRDGKLDPATDPITPSLENEMRIRLGLQQGEAPGAPDNPFAPPPDPTCPALGTSQDIAPAKGDQLLLTGSITVVALNGGEQASKPVFFNDGAGQLLTVGFDGLHLRVRPFHGEANLCPAR